MTGPGKEIARRVVDDLIKLSGEPTVDGYMNFFKRQQISAMRHFVNRMREEVRTCKNQMARLNALIAEMEAFDNPGEVFDTLIGLRDDVRVEDAKLMGLNDLIVEAEEEIEMKEAQLESYFVYMRPFFILDKLSDVSESLRLEDNMRYVFGRSRGEDESMARLMRDLFLPLRVSLSNKRRLVAELEAVEEVEGVVKYLEHMRVIVARDAVTLGELETPLGRAEVYIYTISLKLLSIAALYILDKLTGVASSSRVQDKMKAIFVQARGADESFIALMRDLCPALRVSIAKNRRLITELDALGQPAEASKPLDYMKEMVVRDFATLGVLEQLLAGAHVGMRLKASYVVAMEERE
uniref:Uncharacterized protein n=1 Tax=Tanacetum cinerariifolium TaxID=118510 RepID=A0A6L2JQI9_TANCI|nr:hypothetical protein [Tanacetum cinerariifolium]